VVGVVEVVLVPLFVVEAVELLLAEFCAAAIASAWDCVTETRSLAGYCVPLTVT
jgi:hypothetical protein